MNGVLQDLRFAFRTLSRAPVFTAVAAAILALGIGANGAIFSLTNAMLLRPFPAERPSELLRVSTVNSDGRVARLLSYPDYLDLRDQAGAFSNVAGATGLTPVLMSSPAGGSRQLLGELVTGNYFHALEIRVIAGRAISPQDDAEGAGRAVVIAERLWRSEFGANPSLTGLSVTLNGESFAVVGVAPEKFPGASAGAFIDVWVPVRQASHWLGPDWLAQRSQRRMITLARLRTGVAVADAQAEINVIAERLAQQHPAVAAELRMRVEQARYLEGNLRGPITAFLAVLMLIVGLVLLTACANLANLVLVRAAARRREMAIRLALGAGKLRIVRQFFAESLLLAVLGGAGGLLTAVWTSNLLMQFNPLPQTIPVRFDLAPDARVFAFIAGASLLAGILLGVAPLLGALRFHVGEAMKSEVPAARGHRSRARNVFVAAQVAASVVLLISAGLFLRSLANAREIPMGFEPRNALAMDLDIGNRGWPAERTAQFYDQLIERLRGAPGVAAVAAVDLAPLDIATPRTGVIMRHSAAAPAMEPPQFSLNRVSAGYFATMQIPLVAGRDFDSRDNTASQRVAIINETMAARFWPGESAIGRSFMLTGDTRIAVAPRVEVVGVARNVKYRTLGEAPEAHIYLPYSQHPDDSRTLVVRTLGDPAPMIAEIQRHIHNFDPAAQGFFARTMTQHIGLAMLPARMSSTLAAGFGALALLLAVVGLYGVVAYTVAQRTREIGIRIALGAQPGDVLRLMLGHGARLITAGIVAGAIAAFALARFFSGLLHGVSVLDPSVYAGAVALLAGVGLTACYLPARRASRVDPMVALRYE